MFGANPVFSSAALGAAFLFIVLVGEAGDFVFERICWCGIGWSWIIHGIAEVEGFAVGSARVLVNTPEVETGQGSVMQRRVRRKGEWVPVVGQVAEASAQGLVLVVLARDRPVLGLGTRDQEGMLGWNT